MKILHSNIQVEKPVQLENLRRRYNNTSLFNEPILRKLITSSDRPIGITILDHTGDINLRGIHNFGSILREDVHEIVEMLNSGKLEVTSYINIMRFLTSEIKEISTKIDWYEQRRSQFIDSIHTLENVWTDMFNKIKDTIKTELAKEQVNVILNQLDVSDIIDEPINRCLTEIESIEDFVQILGVAPNFKPEHFQNGFKYERGTISGYVQVMMNPSAFEESSYTDARIRTMTHRVYMVIFIKSQDIYKHLINELRRTLPNELEKAASVALHERNINFTIMTLNNMRYIRKIKQHGSEGSANDSLEEHKGYLKIAVDAIAEHLGQVDATSINIHHIVENNRIDETINAISTKQLIEMIDKISKGEQVTLNIEEEG